MSKPFHDKETLERLLGEGLDQEEIAERFGVSPPTINYWFQKHGLTDPDTKNGVYHEQDGEYYRVKVRHTENDYTTFGESALAALAAGADPYEVFNDTTNIHHKNRQRLDNRPANVEVVTEMEHVEIHQNEIWTIEDGWPEILHQNDKNSKMRLKASPSAAHISAD